MVPVTEQHPQHQHHYHTKRFLEAATKRGSELFFKKSWRRRGENCWNWRNLIKPSLVFWVKCFKKDVNWVGGTEGRSGGGSDSDTDRTGGWRWQMAWWNNRLHTALSNPTQPPTLTRPPIYRDQRFPCYIDVDILGHNIVIDPLLFMTMVPLFFENKLYSRKMMTRHQITRRTKQFHFFNPSFWPGEIHKMMMMMMMMMTMTND